VYVFGVQIRKLGRVDQESIDSDVLEIVRFAEAVDGEYDGWETEVVRPPGSFKSFLRRLGFN
jgi:regulator of RNase E activity RraB